MENQLQNIKERLYSTPREDMIPTGFDQVSKTIEKLEPFHKLIQKGIQDRIYKMKNQGSRIKDIELLEIGDASPSSEPDFRSYLGLDVMEQIIQKVWDGQVDKLSVILHEISLPMDNYQKSRPKQDELFLALQNLIFQQVGYMYKQKMISGEAFKNFCQSKKTLDIAALNMIATTSSHQTLLYLSPATVLNEWTSEHFRNIYEGEYEEQILINTKFPLNVTDI